MTRTYELGFIVEPRQNDDEVQAITDRFTGMLEDAGSKVTYVDHWGKRKLAYPIRKFQEGKYVFVYVTSEDGSPPWPDIERLMMQDEKILRFLVIRTDEDLKRAFRKGKVKPEVPGTKKAEDAEAASSEEKTEKKADAAEEKAETASSEEKAEKKAEVASSEEKADAAEEKAADEKPAEAASSEEKAEAADETPAEEKADAEAEADADAEKSKTKGEDD